MKCADFGDDLCLYCRYNKNFPDDLLNIQCLVKQYVDIVGRMIKRKPANELFMTLIRAIHHNKEQAAHIRCMRQAVELCYPEYLTTLDKLLVLM